MGMIIIKTWPMKRRKNKVKAEKNRRRMEIMKTWIRIKKWRV